MKRLFLTLLLVTFAIPAFCVELEEVNSLKNPSYRVGTGSNPEIRYSEIEAQKQAKLESETILRQKEAYLASITYADTTLKKISDELYKELKIYNEEILSDLRLLWLGAASKSETIKFAIYKLSNPDENKPSTNPIKKIIRPLASITSLASLGLGDPITSTTAMIGSNLLSAFSYDNKDLNYKYTKVTDADMVVLMSKIDSLQNQILICYTNYISSKNALEMSYKVMAKRYNYQKTANKLSDKELLVVDAYYREAQNTYEKNKAEFESRRAELEQLVGIDALNEFEENLTQRN